MITGMPASTAASTESCERRRVGERHDEPVDTLTDGGVDHLRLRRAVVVGALVLHRDAEVGSGLLGTLLGDRPEDAVVAVGDDRDRDVVALDDVDRVARRAARRLIRRSGVAAGVVGGGVAGNGVVRRRHHRRLSRAD